MGLDIHEKEAKVLGDSSCEAHDEEGRGDHDPAIAPIRGKRPAGLSILHQDQTARK